MQRITPFLWFDGNAEEAVDFYMSVFDDSRITQLTHYTEAGPGPVGSVMVIAFQLEGQDFTALNGGPEFKFTPAISLVVNCKDQEEVDRLWVRLTDGGKSVQCGWLEDKFGVSWQIVPAGLVEMMQDDNPERTRRVMEAMFKMEKLDIATLKRAYDQPLEA